MRLPSKKRRASPFSSLNLPTEHEHTQLLGIHRRSRIFFFRSRGSPLKAIKLEGEWKVVASTDDGERELTWTFKQDGKLKGTSLDEDSFDERDFDRIMIKEKKVTLETDIEADGRSGKIVVNGEEKSFGKLAGKWTIVGDDGVEYMSGDFTAMKEVKYAGEWDAISILPSGEELDHTVNLDGKNSKLKGFIDGSLGKIDLNKAKAKNGELVFEFTFTMEGNTMDAVIEASPKNENHLVGEWTVESPDGEMSGDWSAKRKVKSIAGKWKTVAVVPDYGDYEGTLDLVMKDGKYSGKTAGNDGESLELKKVAFDGKEMVFSFPFDRDGITGTIKVEAKMQKDGSFKGEWSLTGEDGQEYARDEWKATPQK